jgi:hypothetical protein
MFIEISANKNSLAQRKLHLGVGINDALYRVNPKINGKYQRCPYYRKWSSMLNRCYSTVFHAKNPTYKDCTVYDEWLTFSVFKAWMEKQDWQKKDLDKDILFQGNKEYSPSTCLFVDPKINRLLGTNDSKRGDLPMGICFSERDKRFIAQCSVLGNRKCLGYYKTLDEAHSVYKRFKSKAILEIALKQIEPLKSALIRLSKEYF